MPGWSVARVRQVRIGFWLSCKELQVLEKGETVQMCMWTIVKGDIVGRGV